MAALWCSRRLLRRSRLPPLTRQSGYIVLLPEIGEDLSEKDSSLVNQEGLPQFNDFTIEKCVVSTLRNSFTVEESIKGVNQKVTDVFNEVLNPIEHLEAPLELTWGVAKTLYLGNNSAMPTKSYMQIHEKAGIAKAAKFTNKNIYDSVVDALNSKSSFSDEECRVLQKYELEGRLNGLLLNKDDALLFGKYHNDLLAEINTLSQKHKLGINQYVHTLSNPEIIKKFPVNLLRNMALDQNEPARGPWKVTHQPNVYDAFMEYCPNKTLRFNAWHSYIRVCSNRAERSLITSSNLEKIRFLRKLKANLLGYESFAEMSMETKMAGSLKHLKGVLSSLLERARLMQQVEMEQLEDFAHDLGQKDKLELCDVEYWKREQKTTLFEYGEDELRDYFPLPIVLQGLLELSSKLFDIKITERSKVSVWHDNVKYYEIFNSNSSTPIAGFYLDPYAKMDENIGFGSESGWMIPICNRSSIVRTKPMASLVFNFPVPMYGKPSLLSFEEVKSLFFRFGQALRHLLTEANYSSTAGLSNVEWDAVFVPGYVMTNWAYEPHVLKAISSHYTTHESLPDEIIANLNLARKHMAGDNLCKELYKCSLDLELHSTKKYWRDVVKEIWPNYHTLPYDINDCHPCTFTKILCDVWGAAYYSNVWSQMIAADVYGAFQEVNDDEKSVLKVGRRFRDTFLALGGSYNSNEVFRRFRGRDPTHKLFLQTLGLIKTH